VRGGPVRVLLGAAALASGCATAGSLSAHLHIVEAAGISRAWYQYDPPGLSTPAPLVIALHGFGEQPHDLMGVTGLDVAAARDGFVVAYPVGVQRSWDAGDCCGAAAARHTDDDGFLATLIARLVASGEVDGRRVYLVGFSNGAFMALRFACDRPDLIAGAVAVEGTLVAPCLPHPPTSLLMIEQAADAVVPLAGTRAPPSQLGDAHPFPPVRAALLAFAGAQACTPSPSPSGPPGVTVEELACPGRRVVRLDVLRGGAHTWPHGSDAPLDATSALIAFFGLHR
jgi:polyhydroxybutyrate depolymerase